MRGDRDAFGGAVAVSGAAIAVAHDGALVRHGADGISRILPTYVGGNVSGMKKTKICVMRSVNNFV
jgi:hypothetical protein